MLIDLSNVLSEPHRSVDETVPCELKIFRNGLGEYPVTDSSDVHVKINYMENGKSSDRRNLQADCRDSV